MNVLVTGDRGFIASYVIPKLLEGGHKIVGIDNYRKYRFLSRPFDKDITHYHLDASDYGSLCELMENRNIDVVVLNAALVGGIKYFHDFPFDIICENSQSVAVTVKAAIRSGVKQVILISSSMVYENATAFPVVEGDELNIPPPISSYGLQKLHSEYVVRAAHEQYGLNYTILRPFNAVGIGEVYKPDDPGFAHVIPDLVYKVLSGQDPIEIIGNGTQVRSFTHASDVAEGVRLCVGNKAAFCNDFNLVNPNNRVSINELADMIMKKVGVKRNRIYLWPFKYDVKYRYGTHNKARWILGWEPRIGLDEILDEMIRWVGAQFGYNIRRP